MSFRLKFSGLGLLLVFFFLIGSSLFTLHCCAEMQKNEIPITLHNNDLSVDAMLEPGTVVNTKMKSLASGTETDYMIETDDIKAIRMSDSLPDNFMPSDANTVSTPDSLFPVYVFYEYNNGSGIIYFYSKAETISLNPDSGYLFAFNNSLSDISGVATWDASRVISLCFLFMRDFALADISPISGWNTSSVTDMSRMFAYATCLPDALAIRSWDTSNVTTMRSMFIYASSLTTVDVSQWNTSKVNDMANMFSVGDSHSGNGQLNDILGLGNLDVSNVTDMTCMFYGAGQMTYYDISHWNVSKVESMNHMFCDNYSLRSLNLSAWDVSSVKTIFCMFDDCQKLKTIGDVSKWNTASLIDAGGWLNDARSFVGNNLGILDLSGWNTCNLMAAGEMFLNTKIHTIDLSGWSFDNISNDLWEGARHGIYYEVSNSSEKRKGMGQMFCGTSELENVYISQSGLESYNTAVEREVNILDMWAGSKADSFTVR